MTVTPRSPGPVDDASAEAEQTRPTPDGLQHDTAGRRRPLAAAPLRITCADYGPAQVAEEEVHDLDDFLERHRPPWSRVRWIDVDGLSRLDAITGLAEKYQLHPLAIEDVLHGHQAPKVEDYPGSEELAGRLFIVARAIEIRNGVLHSDQVSFFLGRTTLLTFHREHAEDIRPIRQRIRNPGSRVRQNDVGFLLYTLLDGIVDHYYPVLERYATRLIAIDEEIMTNPSQGSLREVHAIKRELLTARRVAWPMRELLSQLQRDSHECLSEIAQTYLRDVYDHTVEVIDLIETYTQTANSMSDTYISIMSNRTNEVMRVLTIIATIFIPLTFLAGVYGMNMPIPENESGLAYPMFWVICISLAGGMLLWFRRRGWL